MPYDPYQRNSPFNQLTPAQVERLAILSEECGEIQQVIGKILRHGYESSHPSDPDSVTNRTHLENEIGDMYYALRGLYRDNEISVLNALSASTKKAERVKQYLHHNED